MPHPNSLANLKPWKPGERPPSPGPSKIERTLKIAKDAAPHAAKLLARCVKDPEVPISLRLRCAEYLIDKVLPTQKGAISLETGIDWLELRFVAPGSERPPETLRIAFEDHGEEGEIIDAEPQADPEC